ncbi:MAG: hypothetical protein V3T17_11860 [Pseudomonadales bacterium]
MPLSIDLTPTCPQILDARNRPDKTFPIFTSVPVPIAGAGNERGLFGLPKKGTIVEIAFARGLPSHPFVRTVLAHSLVVPAIEGDEIRWQQSASVFQRADKNGNWERSTTSNITDTADNLTEQIEKIRDSLAKQKQLIKTNGTLWLGNANDNILKLLSDLAAVVSSLASNAATHTHPTAAIGPPSPPAQAVAFTANQTDANTMKTTLDPMVE